MRASEPRFRGSRFPREKSQRFQPRKDISCMTEVRAKKKTNSATTRSLKVISSSNESLKCVEFRKIKQYRCYLSKFLTLEIPGHSRTAKARFGTSEARFKTLVFAYLFQKIARAIILCGSHRKPSALLGHVAGHMGKLHLYACGTL